MTLWGPHTSECFFFIEYVLALYILHQSLPVTTLTYPGFFVGRFSWTTIRGYIYGGSIFYYIYHEPLEIFYYIFNEPVETITGVASLPEWFKNR